MLVGWLDADSPYNFLIFGNRLMVSVETILINSYAIAKLYYQELYAMCC